MPPSVETNVGDTRTLRVDRVARDRLVSIATTGRPIDAIAELLWNGLDADATRIEVRFRRHKLGGIAAIEITDNGTGIPRELALSQFRRIGGSWKRKIQRSQGGRPLQGKEGQGRLRAFALGDRVRWTSCCEVDGQREAFEISGTRETLDRFELGPTRTSTAKRRKPGTKVLIDNVPESVRGLDDQASRIVLERMLAGYLQQYPAVQIVYDGTQLDRTRGIDREDTAQFVFSGSDNVEHAAQLRVVEWSRTVARRSLYFCDELGNALHEERAAIQAPHFEFTAYVSSPRIAELASEGALDFEGLHPDTRALSAAVRECLREHFRQRSEDEAQSRVDRWRGASVYPYEEEVVSEAEVVQRDVFDACARQIETSWPQYAVQPPQTRRLLFDLLRHALEAPSAGAIESSLTRGLGLSEERRRELGHAIARLSSSGLGGALPGSGDDASTQGALAGRAAALDTLWARFCQGDISASAFAAGFDARAPACWPQLEHWQAHAEVSELFVESAARVSWPVAATENETTSEPRALDLGDRVSDRAQWFEVAGSRILWRLAVPVEIAAQAHFAVNKSTQLRPRLWLLVPEPVIDDRWASAIKELGHELAMASLDGQTAHAQLAQLAQLGWRIDVVASALSPAVARDARQAMRPEGLLYAASEGDCQVWARTWASARAAAAHGV